MGSLDAMRDELRAKTLTAATSAARQWEQELQRTSPVDTGDMASRTRVTATRHPFGAEITASVDTSYAEMVATGTRPHVITPRRPGGVLRFMIGGRVVFAARVNHPGARPDAWWDTALKNVPDLIRRAWR